VRRISIPWGWRWGGRVIHYALVRQTLVIRAFNSKVRGFHEADKHFLPKLVIYFGTHVTLYRPWGRSWKTKHEINEIFARNQISKLAINCVFFFKKKITWQNRFFPKLNFVLIHQLVIAFPSDVVGTSSNLCVCEKPTRRQNILFAGYWMVLETICLETI